MECKICKTIYSKISFGVCDSCEELFETAINENDIKTIKKFKEYAAIKLLARFENSVNKEHIRQIIIDVFRSLKGA